MKTETAETTMGELRVAVIGCGYWGVNYLRLLDDLPFVREVLAVDDRPARRKDIAERFPRVSIVPDLDSLLEEDLCDAAIVSTPAQTHLAVTRRLLQAGKHVLVEKPITTKSVDAEELIQLADSRGLTLAVGQTFVYHEAVKKVQSYIDRGDAGSIYYLYSRRTNLGPIRGDVNALWDLAPHDISIFNLLLHAQPIWVSAVGHNPLRSPNADVGFVTLGYPDDVVAHLHVSWADPSKVRELVVVGSDLRIVFDDMNSTERVKVYEKGVVQPNGHSNGYGHSSELVFRDGDIFSPRLEPSEPLKTQTIDFLECALSGRVPRSSGQLGLDVVRVMEAIDRSMNQSGVPALVHDGAVVAVDDGLTRVDLNAMNGVAVGAREAVG